MESKLSAGLREQPSGTEDGGGRTTNQVQYPEFGQTFSLQQPANRLETPRMEDGFIALLTEDEKGLRCLKEPPRPLPPPHPTRLCFLQVGCMMTGEPPSATAVHKVPPAAFQNLREKSMWCRRSGETRYKLHVLSRRRSRKKNLFMSNVACNLPKKRLGEKKAPSDILQPIKPGAAAAQISLSCAARLISHSILLRPRAI